MKKDINEFINSLQYDVNEIQSRLNTERETVVKFNEDEIDASLTKREHEEIKTTDSKGRKVLIRSESVDITSETEEIDILNDMHNSCYPGGLVSIDSKFFEGKPSPLLADPGNILISTDLPNSRMVEIESPNQATVSAGVDMILKEWLENEGSKGYDTKSNISFKHAEFHETNQIGAELGINANALPASFLVNLKGGSNIDKRTDFVLFKQTFFTANFSPSSNHDHSSLFSKETDLDVVKNACSNGRIPGYVDSVEYGRMVLLKIESERSSKNMASELDVKILNAGDIKAQLNSEKIVENSKISAIIIGGSNTSNSKVFDIKKADELKDIIQGCGAKLSKESPAAAISYKVRDLKNRSLVGLNLGTHYIKREVEILEPNTLKLSNRGAYNLQARVSYKENKQEQIKDLLIVPNNKKILELGDTATEVKVKLKATITSNGKGKDIEIYEDLVGKNKVKTTGSMFNPKSTLTKDTSSIPLKKGAQKKM